MKDLLFIVGFFVLTVTACRSKETVIGNNLPDKFIVVLGIAQDAGYPQIGCEKECCIRYWEGKEKKKYITSLALVDRKASQYWLFEATPDITDQLHTLQTYLPAPGDYTPDGIFITHAHIGHYSGLMELGREAMGAKGIPVWVMPRMDSFLRNNGPWSQLVSLRNTDPWSEMFSLNNIELYPLQKDSTVSISASFRVTPIKVPHRDEFSETVGFIIQSDRKKIFFIPDIDKWEKWDRDILAEVAKVDLALLDGTFYRNSELPGRDMREIPHPFVKETMDKFATAPDSIRSRIVFIHFNHTNPLLRKKSGEKARVKAAGYGVAEEGAVYGL